MLDWKVLIIGLIPLGVWILSTIFRGMEDARENERAAAWPQGDKPRGPRRPTTELDRFLDEARKRREAAPQRRNPLDADPPPRVESRPAKPRRQEPAPAPPPQMPVHAVLDPLPPLPVHSRPPPPPVLARVVAMLRDRDTVKAAMVLREILDRPVSQRRR